MTLMQAIDEDEQTREGRCRGISQRKAFRFERHRCRQSDRVQTRRLIHFSL
jgi:hypothetical protein